MNHMTKLVMKPITFFQNSIKGIASFIGRGMPSGSKIFGTPLTFLLPIVHAFCLCKNVKFRIFS